MFEDLGVFKRIGEETDVVSRRRCSTFFDKGDPPQHLAPASRADGVDLSGLRRTSAGAAVEGLVRGSHSFATNSRRPAGYRQFTQVGVEVLGADDPQVDIDVIALGSEFYASLGLREIELVINSMGDASCRPRYMEALTDYLQQRRSDLSPQSQVTLDRNPLRVLDSKRDDDQAVVAAAPSMVDYLNEECGDHFAVVRAGLDSLGISYSMSPRLVRGFDYYTKTVFEFVGEALGGSQNAVGGGGRYDGLVEDLGGPATPGIGFALGVDRILLACDAERVFPAPAAAVKVFVVDVTGGSHALGVCTTLREAGIGADRAYGGRSMKAQMKVADRSGAPYAAIIGACRTSVFRRRAPTRTAG